MSLLLADLAAASEAVAAVGGRTAKAALLADVVRRAGPAEAGLVVTWLAGAPRQRRTGIGWAGLRDPGPPADLATLTLGEVDALLDRAQAASGAGSALARAAIVTDLLGRATAAEQRFLTGLLAGELRQGAQAGLLLDAVALAAAVPKDALRRATTLAADPAAVATAALTGGVEALAAFGLRVGVPLSPMLAASAPDLAGALAKTGPAAVEWKLDGVRVQVHKDGDDIAVFSRSLDELTRRLPEVVEAARALPVPTAVLDGEVIALRQNGRPHPFQVTAARVARQDTADARARTPLTVTVFDALHLAGVDLVDAPDRQRRAALIEVAPGDLLVPRTELEDVADEAGRARVEAFAAGALARGHEGVLVKGLDVPYAMGRRGTGWVKVKPRITLDLVVLAAEWGHGRRQGWLSNLHLGARDPAGEYGPAGGFVMLGKTFKGLTDAMLTWQTEHLTRLAERTTSWQVQVRPELVVEIAFDGVQDSPRYPAGMALRFARVLAHRPDKPAAQADTLDAVRAHRDAARA